MEQVPPSLNRRFTDADSPATVIGSGTTARVVTIADGAFYEGSVRMQGQDAPNDPVFFKERRSGSEDRSPG